MNQHVVPPSDPPSIRCLILACGNTLRGDDGVGPWLAAWAEERFRAEPGVRVVSRQQWTPELAEDIASAGSVLFLDCSLVSPAGAVEISEIKPVQSGGGLESHHQGAPELLALARELYAAAPEAALLVTVGAGSTELGEEFSGAVQAALPHACVQLEAAVLHLIAADAPGQRA